MAPQACIPPFSWSAFKLKYPAEGVARAGQVGIQADLETVNAKVNRMARQVGPLPALDQWLIWPARAWCHDYAVTKRHELLTLGWPSSSLLIAECRTDEGEAPIVSCSCEQGLRCADARAELLPWDSTGLRLVAADAIGGRSEQVAEVLNSFGASRAKNWHSALNPGRDRAGASR